MYLNSIPFRATALIPTILRKHEKNIELLILSYLYIDAPLLNVINGYCPMCGILIHDTSYKNNRILYLIAFNSLTMKGMCWDYYKTDYYFCDNKCKKSFINIGITDHLIVNDPEQPLISNDYKSDDDICIEYNVPPDYNDGIDRCLVFDEF